MSQIYFLYGETTVTNALDRLWGECRGFFLSGYRKSVSGYTGGISVITLPEKNPLFFFRRADFLLCIVVRCRMSLCLYFLVRWQSRSSCILGEGNYEKLGNFPSCFQEVVYQICRGVFLQKYLYSIGDHFENELLLHSPGNKENSYQKNQNIWREGGILDIVSKPLLVWAEICMKKGSEVSEVADRGYFLFQK